jgi:hypothetical protein
MRHRPRTRGGFDESRMHRIVNAVIDCNGSRAKAARLLGVNIEVVRRQINNASIRGIFVPDPARTSPEQPEQGYLPSHEVIAAECREIRKGWDRITKERRRIIEREPYTIPSVSKVYLQVD